jgi:hypothetical protein
MSMHDRIGEALTRADILPSIKWSLALLSVGARILCALGTTEEMYLGLCTSMFEQRPTAHALSNSLFPDPEEIPGMRARLVAALRDSSVELADHESAAHLVILAACAAEERDVTLEVWLELARALYVDAEGDLHWLAREKGGQA